MPCPQHAVEALHARQKTTHTKRVHTEAVARMGGCKEHAHSQVQACLLPKWLLQARAHRHHAAAAGSKENAHCSGTQPSSKIALGDDVVRSHQAAHNHAHTRSRGTRHPLRVWAPDGGPCG
jgi:hypothetical protein